MSPRAETDEVARWAFPDHDPRSPAVAAHWLALERTLTLLDQALPCAGVLVKGAALALTVYGSPHDRPMSDIDVLVPFSDVERARNALVANGFRPVTTSRPLSQLHLDVKLLAPMAAVSVLVELHGSIDKVASRRIDYAAIFRRAMPLTGMARLATPCPEDHVVLVALHLGGDEFKHRPGFADVALLLARGADVDTIVERARVWKASTVVGLAFDMLDEMFPGIVPARAVGAIRTRSARRRLLRRWFAPPLGATQPRALGLPWIARQTLLRDDLPAWGLGLARYGGKRVLERFFVKSSGR
ncbi:MAG TPA: nucleotidyltransferase family protein [Polyangiaceae bacterium]|jgi:hypothetical protein|nr:nucleotidyltransferase family protein [Polyangiaceae bacterium]